MEGPALKVCIDMSTHEEFDVLVGQACITGRSRIVTVYYVAHLQYIGKSSCHLCKKKIFFGGWGVDPGSRTR